jgi:Xaa-Pro aminopeptidase
VGTDYDARVVPDVLILGDTIRSPDARHEVPVAIPDAILYVERDGDRHAVVGSFEVPRLEHLRGRLEPHAPEEFGLDDFLEQGLDRESALLRSWLRAAKELGVREAVVPPTFGLELADALREEGVAVRADRDFFVRRRRAKNDAELAGIRRAQRAAEAGLRAGLELLRRAETRDGALVLDGEPLTCERLKADIEAAFSAHECSAEEMIVSHGPQTAIGHDMGSGQIRADEPIVFDLFPRDRESGCYADMTRTFVVGEASDELREYHRLVKQALDEALAAIRPGVTGHELMQATCDLFHRHGYPTPLHKRPGEVLADGFFHGLGHGVGLEVHEAPRLSRNGEELIPGDVVTIEPGLYRNGYGGVRLEDLVLVTEDGCENLTDFPYDLEP